MGHATPIVLTDERQELERLSRGRRVSVRLAQRASIVLLAAELGEQTGRRAFKDHATDGKALRRVSFNSINGLIGAIHEHTNAHNADAKPII